MPGSVQESPSPHCMKCVHRSSITEKFVHNRNKRIPAVPMGGVRIQVWYAGACYTEEQSDEKRLRQPGVHDTSLFPGYEISGVIQEVCSTVTGSSDWRPGDRVILYPDDSETSHSSLKGFEEYITVRNLDNLVKIPECVSMATAALLPCGGLRVYTAVLRIQSFIEWKICSGSGTDVLNLLIVGAGGLGLWTVQMANYLLCVENKQRPIIRVIVADTCVKKLTIAKQHGCSDIIEWNEAIYEEEILNRTYNVCPIGVDFIIDFVSSPRTINRSLKVLNQDGVLVVGGNSKYPANICLHSLASKNQSILGVRNGTKQHLKDLVHAFASKAITPPSYSVHSLEEINSVYERLSQCQLYGRAVLKISQTERESVEGNLENTFENPKIKHS